MSHDADRREELDVWHAVWRNHWTHLSPDLAGLRECRRLAAAGSRYHIHLFELYTAALVAARLSG